MTKVKTEGPFSFPETATLSSCALGPLALREATRASRILAQMDPWRTLGYSVEGLFRYLATAAPGLTRYHIGCGDEFAGVLFLRYPWLLGPLIELIAIFDGFRGKGLGGEIIGWAAAQTPAANVWVTVSSFNAGARRFYRRIGFSETAVLEDLVRRGFDEILLRKRK